MWSLNPIESWPASFPEPVTALLPTVPSPDAIVTTAPVPVPDREEIYEARKNKAENGHVDITA